MLQVEAEMSEEFRTTQKKAENGEMRRAELLLRDQRAWAKARETHCEVEIGRSSWKYWLQFRYAKCIEEEARKRTLYLKSLPE
jgi:uncharacterized protein YecT (DUF1311 family)